MFRQAKKQLWIVLRCAFTNPTGKPFAANSHPLPSAMVLLTSPKFQRQNVLGWFFLFVILGHFDEGWTILSSALENCHNSKPATTHPQTTARTGQPAPKRHCYKPEFKDILQVFEALLCFDEWLRKDSYWPQHGSEVKMANISHSIAKLMHMSKKYIPTSKSTAWNYPKFHEFTHIVDDMMRFGAPQNFLCATPRIIAYCSR